MKSVPLLNQIGGEGDFKLCEILKTAEDKVHSGQKKESGFVKVMHWKLHNTSVEQLIKQQQKQH